MAHTKYSHLTDDELLRMVDDARPKSPLIEELATRLEKTVKAESPEPGRTTARSDKRPSTAPSMTMVIN